MPICIFLLRPDFSCLSWHIRRFRPHQRLGIVFAVHWATFVHGKIDIIKIIKKKMVNFKLYLSIKGQQFPQIDTTDNVSVVIIKHTRFSPIKSQSMLVFISRLIKALSILLFHNVGRKNFLHMIWPSFLT